MGSLEVGIRLTAYHVDGRVEQEIIDAEGNVKRGRGAVQDTRIVRWVEEGQDYSAPQQQQRNPTPSY